MSDADEFLDFHLGENSFIDNCLGNDYIDTSATTPHSSGQLVHYGRDSCPPGPVRSPKRRGRPIANNAARERTRVKTLRSAFLDLQRTLPAVPPDTKLSKLDVLVLATTYIAHLMSALADDGDISQIFAANGCMHPVKHIDGISKSDKGVDKEGYWQHDNVEDIIRNLLWTELDVDDEGKVSVNELGRCLRQHGVDVSIFMILRILSDGTTPHTSMDHGQFVDTKDKLIIELTSTEPLSEADKKKKQRATYLDLWREHSRSKDESGEIPLSNLPDVIFSECNPTKALLDALMALKSDGSESLNFDEFCEMLDNLPSSGMIDEDMLMLAFKTEDTDGSGVLSRTQLYSLLIENGTDPLKKEEVDEMMEDCGMGDKFKYSDWVQRVITIKTQSEN